MLRRKQPPGSRHRQMRPRTATPPTKGPRYTKRAAKPGTKKTPSTTTGKKTKIKQAKMQTQLKTNKNPPPEHTKGNRKRRKKAPTPNRPGEKDKKTKPGAAYSENNYGTIKTEGLKTTPPPKPQAHKAAEKRSVNYSEQTVPVTHPQNEEIRTQHIIPAMLRTTTDTGPEPTGTKQPEDAETRNGHTRQPAGGLTERHRQHNTKRNTHRTRKNDPHGNPTDKQNRKQDNHAVSPTTPRKTKNKTKPERDVHGMKPRITPRIRNESIESHKTRKQRTREAPKTIKNKIKQKQPETPAETVKNTEKPKRKPTPEDSHR
ncbi:hypothetical protein AE51_01964 [Escherichia coli BIDMC 76]|nr:hypothetical protein AE51_01964 [Escherichia coli BIDMC 76]